ncbi:MAG: transglycosylase SLT domain-containing protein [Bacteroidales bacterium]|nr:transglycosylase SLT domain-containing protein [Bacteroidales bacterium]
MLKCRTNIVLWIFSLMSFISFTSVGQNDERSEDYINFERNYNDLLQSYYIKSNEKLLNERFPSTAFMSPAYSAASVSDEVYRQRLNSIPSAVKLVYNKNVRSHIIYYLDRLNKSVGLMLGVSKYYFPIFENILDSYGVPSDLKYLVVIESAFNPRAVSKAGATGLWQFMYATGKTYDLRVNSIIDDRRDPIKSTIAAAKYLNDLYKIYDDWSLVLAAYNCGPGNVNKAIKRSGKNSFWEIYNFLPRETRNYVPAFIAATYVMNFYAEHGIKPVSLTRPLSLITDTVMVNKDIFFGQIGDVLKISVDELRDLNPQYKMDYIPGTQDKYSLRLPLKYINEYIEFEDSISVCNLEKYRPELFKKDTVVGDSNTVFVDKTIYHKVKRNETWTSIAKRYGTSVTSLRQWNPKIKRNKLQAGTLLAIKTKVAVNKNSTTEKSEEEKTTTTSNNEDIQTNNNEPQQEVSTGNNKADVINKNVSKNKVKTKKKQSETSNTNKNTSKTQTEKKTSSPTTHTVQPGETISAIARKYGMNEQQLMKINNLNNASAKKIRPGQKIKLK